ncbi:MAG: hypothetical protein MJ211_16145 [Bacteroidales bacterium]|nr:hypothetical protein [Bacteroidales bacterium]
MKEMNKIEDTLKFMKKIEEFKQWNKLYNRFNKIGDEICKILDKLDPNTLNYDVLMRIKKWAYNIYTQDKELTNEFVKEYSNKLKAYNELDKILSDLNF